MAAAELFSKVSRRIWADEKFCSLSAPPPNARDLWLYLLTGPQNGAIPGLFELGELALAEKLDWEPEPTRACLQEILAKGMARFDRKRRLFWLPNAIAHNLPRSPKQVLGWSKAWNLLPECSLLTEAAAALRAHLLVKGPKFAEAFDRVVAGLADVEQTDSSDEDESPATSPSAGAAPEAISLSDRNRDPYPIETALPMPFQEKEKEKEKEITTTPARVGHAGHGRPGNGFELARLEPLDASTMAADDPTHAPAHEGLALPPPRPGNGQLDAGLPPAVARPAGPDLLAMARELAEAGNVFGRKMVDHAAQARTFSSGQRETIRKVYAEHMEGRANAERSAAMRCGTETPSRSGVETRALQAWEHLWSREHRGETYPTTDRDLVCIRKLVERATTRARTLGGDVGIGDVLKHYFARYLALDDRRLVAERYPLCFLESRLPAIGEYEPARARPASAAPAASPPERRPLKVPDGVIEAVTAPRSASDALRARRL